MIEINVLDQFSRKIGRKISLKRALQPFDKNLRTIVWNEYWGDING